MTRTQAALNDIAERLEEVQALAELPAVTSDDNGKALLVSGGAWAKGALPTELPAVTSADEGKVLTVNSSGQWVAAALPS